MNNAHYSKKTFLLTTVLYFLSLINPLLAQNPPASDDCGSAPFICNPQGYTGNTSDNYDPDLPGNMCESCSLFDGSLENNSWIRFQASSSTITFTLDVSNCYSESIGSSSSGVQFGVYSGTNCNNFTLLSNYSYTGPSGTNGSGTFTITANNLVPGQIYYIMLDGVAGDECDYIITANSGINYNVGSAHPDNQTVCPNSPATIIAEGGTNYHWTSDPADPSLTTQVNNAQITVTPGVTTTYYVEIQGNYCNTTSIVYDTVTVTVSNILPIDLGPDKTMCNGESMTLIATGGTVYSWNTGATTPDLNISPTVTTTYNVTVTNGSTCSGTDAININVSNGPNVDAGLDWTICPHEQILITATGADDYQWNTGWPYPSINVWPTVTTTYIVTGKDTYGCIAKDTVVVNVVPFPTITVTPLNPTICENGSIQISVSGASTYSWSPPTAITPLTGPTVTASPATTTIYTVVAASANNCSAKSYITVSVLPQQFVSVNPTISNICSGESMMITAAGTGPYSWTPNSGISSVSNQVVYVTPSSTTTYTVSVGLGACTASATSVVNVTQTPVISAIPQNPFICHGTSIGLDVTGASTYTWFPVNGLSNASAPSVVASPNLTTTYTIIGKNGICADTTTTTVNVVPTPFAEFSVDSTEACGSVNANFINHSDTAVSNWTWIFGDPGSGSLNTSYIENPSHDYNSVGIYSVTLMVTNSFGCGDTITKWSLVKVRPIPKADFYVNPETSDILSPLFFFNNLTTDANRWIWNYGDPNCDPSKNTSNLYNADHTYTAEGKYTISLAVSNQYGCVDSTQRSISIGPNISYYIPNAFSPNFDGVNDVFNIKGENIDSKTFKMIIFDRWGKQVFSTTNLEEGWNGDRPNSEDSYKTGVYCYFIQFKDLKKKLHKFRGTITIIDNEFHP